VQWSVSNLNVNSTHLNLTRWKQLAQKILVSLAFVVAYLFTVIGSQALVYEAFSTASFFASAQTTAFFIANAVMFGLFFYHRSKTRNQWINDEAQRFLAARSSQIAAPVSRWRKKLRHGLVWGPTIFALGVFLFFPELLGIVSHLPGQPSLDHYRLEIPLTWIIVYDDQTYEGSRLVRSDTWIVATKGIARAGLDAYWHKEEPVSEITLSFAPHESPDRYFPEHAKVLSRQELSLGNETVVCWDIIPFADTRPKPIDPAFAEIICPAGKNGFGAHFSGWRSDYPLFYKALQQANGKS
jgi:hypothetical protein